MVNSRATMGYGSRRGTHKPLVTGSNPVAATFLFVQVWSRMIIFVICLVIPD